MKIQKLVKREKFKTTKFTSKIICVNSSFNRNAGFQSLSISCTFDLNNKSKNDYGM